eukprot:TRINITY_DN15313_c0_g1_i2.p1 TRINITY_DN15313_c0_g1~~TRINITY_DN15313_c0_g1_i2.p1  ORF type:complete len:231 (-),score=28.85 TRINITY_DN15313_c0_g1_i2:48-740(-)
MGLGASKPRILCLHSFRTSGEILRQQMFLYSNFGETLEAAGCELVFVNAPYRCTSEDEEKVYPAVKTAFPDCKKYYEWFRATDDGAEYHRLDDSLVHLDQVMEEQGPFSGLLGFSQGGTVAHLMAFLQASRQRFSRHPPLEFLIILSSRRSRATIHRSLWETPSPEKLPRAFVMYGGRDKSSTTPQDVETLISTLPGAQTVYLPEGEHRVPQLTEEHAERLRQFVGASKS